MFFACEAVIWLASAVLYELIFFAYIRIYVLP